MPEPPSRRGATNTLYPMVAVALLALMTLGYFLFGGSAESDRGKASKELFLFCAAGMRYPMEIITEDYEREHGVIVQLQYGDALGMFRQALRKAPQGGAIGFKQKVPIMFFHCAGMLTKIPKIRIYRFKTLDARALELHLPTPSRA